MHRSQLSFYIYRFCLYVGSLCFILGIITDNTLSVRSGFGLLFLAIIFKLDLR